MSNLNKMLFWGVLDKLNTHPNINNLKGIDVIWKQKILLIME